MKLSHIATAIGGLVSGLMISSFFDLGISFGVLLVFLAVVFLFEAKFFGGVNEDKKLQIYLSVFLIFTSLAIFRYSSVDTKNEIVGGNGLPAQGDEASREGFVRAEGLVTDEPSEKDKSITLKVTLERVSKTTGEVISERPMNILVTSKSLYQKFNYGDRVEVIGDLKRVKNFSADFDYQAYLAKDEIYYQFQNPKISLVSRGNGSFIQEKLYDIKNSFLENINKVIPAPESALMGGIVIGAKSSLGQDILDTWRRVGLIQVVVLSGYNISVVADAVAQVLAFLPLGMRIGFGSLAIILFSMMTGGGATVVRATIMALLAILARATGRIYMSGAALLVGGILIVLYNPKTLVFDTSFQLSFIATAGLIFLSPVIEKYLKKQDSTLRRLNLLFLNILAPTIAAQLAIFPIIAYKMGMISIVSIPANILVSPFVPVTMFLGFLTGVVGYLSYFLSLPFAYVSYFFLAYDLKIADLFASLPFASVDISFPLWLTIFIYFGYVVWIIKTPIDESPKS
ncbi:MAG: ComEC/Rec2 family competence protein [Patescibacteria group bacterium]